MGKSRCLNRKTRRDSVRAVWNKTKNSYGREKSEQGFQQLAFHFRAQTNHLRPKMDPNPPRNKNNVAWILVMEGRKSLNRNPNTGARFSP